MPSTLTGEHWIGAGRSLESASPRFHAADPQTGKRLEPAFVDATPGEIDRAMRLAAAAAFRLRSIDRETKARLLERIAEGIETLGDTLIERAHHETALPVARLVSERGRTCGQLRLFAEVVKEGSWVEARIDHADPDRRPIPRPDLRRMLRPLGPVVVFGSSNFPLAFSVAGGDTASALAAGCPVVVKAHPHHPGTSELVAGVVVAAVRALNLPDGTFSMVHGISNDVGHSLVTHARTRAVGFTGSLRGGRALFDAAARRPEPIPVYAEMGSTNPVFILPGAAGNRPSEIAAQLVQSVTLGCGQFCTNPGVVVMLREGSEALLHEVTRGMIAAPDGTMLHEGIRKAYDAAVERLGRSPGVASLGRPRGSSTGGCTATPALFAVDAERFLADPSLGEEVFGPSTIVVLCHAFEEMVEIATSLEGQLTATIHAEATDDRECAALMPALEDRAGRIVWNGFPTGVEVGHAMHHGGPYPASTDVRSTSVGTAAIARFARPVCFQNTPDERLPGELQESNPFGIARLVDGVPSGRTL